MNSSIYLHLTKYLLSASHYSRLVMHTWIIRLHTQTKRLRCVIGMWKSKGTEYSRAVRTLRKKTVIVSSGIHPGLPTNWQYLSSEATAHTKRSKKISTKSFLIQYCRASRYTNVATSLTRRTMYQP
jgi:hypothetical protein